MNICTVCNNLKKRKCVKGVCKLPTLLLGGLHVMDIPEKEPKNKILKTIYCHCTELYDIFHIYKFFILFYIGRIEHWCEFCF